METQGTLEKSAFFIMREPIRLGVDPAAGAIFEVSSLDEWGMAHWDTHAPSCDISISFPLEYKRGFGLIFIQILVVISI